MSQVPSELKYSREHEWVRLDGDVAIIGITDFAQDELGDIVFVELPKVGTQVTVNATFGTVESVKTVSDLFAPVSGKVIEVNTELEDKPERVNEAPYDAGWMIKVQVVNSSEMEQLLDQTEYEGFISE